MNTYDLKLYQYGSDETETKKLTEYWNKKFSKCTKCHGTRKVKNKAGEYVQCECEKKRDICLMLSLSMFSTKLLSTSMDTCSNEVLLKKGRYYIDNFFKGKCFCNKDGLVIAGKHNSGKTSMAIHIIRALLESFEPYYISTFKTLSVIYDDLVRKSYDFNWANQSDMNKILYATDWLLLDNVGKEMGQNTANKSAVKLLDDILKKRSTLKDKFTYITLNCDIAEFKEIYGMDIFNDIKNKYVLLNAGDFEFTNDPIIL
jgi:DNA replication protein DnaC